MWIPVIPRAPGDGKTVPTAAGMGFGAGFEEAFGEGLGETHNSQSDSKMFLISLEPLRNVVRNGYSHCRPSGL